MRKLLLTSITSVIGVGMMMGMASAATTVTCNGSISNTGANSTNIVNCVDQNNQTVTCSNTGVITQSNTQSSTSGGATTSGNTSSGNASSGNSTNSNTYTVQLGASCVPVKSTATSTSPVVPFTTTAIVAGPTAVKSSTTPSSLPVTGSNTVLKAVEIGLGVLAVCALVAGIGVKLAKKVA